MWKPKVHAASRLECKVGRSALPKSGSTPDRTADIREGEVEPTCLGCPFADSKGVPFHKPVRPQIPSSHPIGVLIGEAPGRDEVAMGLPFQGRTGEELDALLASNHLPRSKLLLINAMGCMAPPSMKTEANMRAAAEHCKPWVQSMVKEYVRAKVPTLAMGKWAGFVATGNAQAVGDKRGFLRWDSKKLRPLILTWHPTFALFFNPWEAANFSADLDRFARATRGKLQKPPKELNIAPTLAEIKALWKEPFITVDIEAAARHPKQPWTGLDPTQARVKVIGLGTRTHGYSMWWAGAHPKVRAEVKKLLASKRILKVLQNGWWYDIRILKRFDLVLRNVRDIRDMRRSLVTTSKLSLGYMASLYLDVADWKAKAGEDGKE